MLALPLSLLSLHNTLTSLRHWLMRRSCTAAHYPSILTSTQIALLHCIERPILAHC